MPRARKALLLPAVVAVVQIVFGVLVFADQTCSTGGDCNDEIIAWFVGVPLIVVGGSCSCSPSSAGGASRGRWRSRAVS